ncbi:penicillin acylase family protein [Phenylobacterium sp.]|uniref:penicillin acylase family protein n=1 Tax=Phenylobacterium sp. TaxID=1871053 RepID=UPI002732BA12|nr:penicillin acylase family protein [Phenylobacterium sp.]
MIRSPAAALILAAGLASSAQAAGYKAEIVRTKYGVPHVMAANYGGLGYGQAYAYAQDNICLIADKIVTVNGERSKHFGADGANTVAFAEIKNLESDFFFRGALDMAALRAAFARSSKDYRDLVTGYVAGYNRYLRDVPAGKRPEPCRGAAWVAPIAVDDMLRLNEERMIQASGGAWLRQINAAAPPSATAPKPMAALGLPEPSETFGLGSNGWAFGRDATANGSGLLLGNPHFPWETTNRFYELHLTIPGKTDVMGVTIAGAPGLSIGFNKDVAWTHTVSTDRHFTLFELALDPSDPTAYLVDGKRHQMTRKDVTVETVTGPQTRAYYSTHYGAVVVVPQAGLGWSPKTAYAIKDANKSNLRSGDTWLAITRAQSVGEIKVIATKTLGIPWVNTIAADRHGDALYADITATPNVSAEKLEACAPSPPAAALGNLARIFVLDGSRSACDWDQAAGTVAPGLMPGDAMPSMIRADYVANSNDSYWLVNPKAPLPAFSPLLGPAAVAQNLRTRSGVVEIERRLAGADGLDGKLFDAAKVRTMLFWNRNLAADLYLDDALKACAANSTATTTAGKTVDLAPACAILAKWDRRMDNESVGAMLFVEFFRLAERTPALFATPFDPADPVNTPRGLKTDADSAAKIAQALAGAVELMERQKLALDAPYGAIHFAIRGDRKIPIHGGEGQAGVLNAQQSRFVAGAGGYVPYHGSSYIQVVAFDAAGPVADAVLSYSQSTDPASAHYADQTELYSKKGWHRLPFHQADIAAEALGPALKLSE